MSPRPPSSFLLSRATNLYALQTRQASQPVTLSYRLNPVGDDCKLSEIKRAQSAVLNPKTLELLNVKATVKAQGSSLQALQHQEVLPLSKIIVSSGPPGPLSAFLSSPSMSAAVPSVCRAVKNGMHTHIRGRLSILRHWPSSYISSSSFSSSSPFHLPPYPFLIAMGLSLPAAHWLAVPDYLSRLRAVAQCQVVRRAPASCVIGVRSDGIRVR
ncbi:hypothetical protein FB451DRAFT_1559943 [Mycena latifolia]|nr:hypothetical protein FB451DRAFT_1559943 [Mycena latifolia]